MDAKKASIAKPMLACKLCGPVFRRRSLYADKADLAESIKKKHANTEVARFPG